MSIEQGIGIGRRLEDRVVGTASLEQGIAAGVGAALAWGACSLLRIGTEIWSPAWWLVAALVVGSAAAAFMLFQRFEGQTPAERLLRRGLFRLRTLTGATTLLSPPEGGATPGAGQGGLVVYHQGRRIARPYRPEHNGEGHHARVG